MLREIVRFRKELRRLADEGDDRTALAEFLKAGRYSATFTKQFLVPMTAAIWSAEPSGLVDDFPARFFAKFFANHGFLDADRPRWKTIIGGARNYVAPLTAPFRDRIRLRTPVRSVARLPDGCEVRSADGVERYDAVVLGVHSDQALRLLENPTPLEREILGAIAYRENEAVLHTDVRQLPARRRAWASWNYYIPASPSERPTVTYYMNLLQSLDAPEPICVTLNRTAEIDPSKILKKLTYHHPVYTRSAVHAQQRRNEINGINRTYYCGAYWGNGFHEDGVNSGIAVAESLGARRFGDA
jgi:predicted NAD/FAD-binding protein